MVGNKNSKKNLKESSTFPLNISGSLTSASAGINYFPKENVLQL